MPNPKITVRQAADGDAVNLTVDRDDAPLLGVIIEPDGSMVIGHWPDGTVWERVANVPALSSAAAATDPFTEERPYNTTLTDSNGARWHFAYWGSGHVYIREMDDDGGPRSSGANASRNDWPYLISLITYSLRPGDITAAWLEERAAEWISDRNDDIANGNITT